MPINIDADAFYTSDEIAEMLQLSTQQVRNLLRTGMINGTRRGKRYYSRGIELINYLDIDRTETPPPPPPTRKGRLPNSRKINVINDMNAEQRGTNG